LAALLLRHSPKLPIVHGRRNILAVAVVSVSVITFAAYALIESDILRHQRYARTTAESVARKVTAGIEQTEVLMQRLGARWNSIDHIPNHVFIQQEFEGYMKDFPYFRSF